MKKYTIGFTQTFHEFQEVEANNADEAEAKLMEEWQMDPANVTIYHLEEVKDD